MANDSLLDNNLGVGPIAYILSVACNYHGTKFLKRSHIIPIGSGGTYEIKKRIYFYNGTPIILTQTPMMIVNNDSFFTSNISNIVTSNAWVKNIILYLYYCVRRHVGGEIGSEWRPVDLYAGIVSAGISTKTKLSNSRIICIL